MYIDSMTAIEQGKLIKKGEISAVELTKHYLDNIKKNDKNINAYITVTEEKALKKAEEVQKLIDSNSIDSPIAGVPMAIKDNIMTKDIYTTCASKMLEGFNPIYNSTVYDKLENSGAIILGKLNMDEFAMGGSTETSFFGPVRNPWDIERVSGGSSGGSAAAVSSMEAAYTLGSDTGGSIRQPCSFCGVSGIKPTYGSVSRYGLVAFASSLDQIGPIGKDIKDCAEILSIISGHDKKDSTSINMPKFDFSDCFESDNIKGMKIGIPINYLSKGIDDDVKNCILNSADIFKKLGAQIFEFEMPDTDYAVAAYYIVACAEASSNLSRYDGIKYGYRSNKGEGLIDVFYNSRSEGFGMEVKRRIMLGSFVLSSGYYEAYYKKGLKTRAVIKNSFDSAFEKYDAILSPIAPTAAFKIGENIKDPLKMYLGDIYTVSVNLAGIPAASIPCGFTKDNLPVGVQIIGPTLSEKKIIKICSAFQNNTDFHKRTCSIKEEK